MTMDSHEFRDLAVPCLWEKLQVLPAGGRMDRIFFTWVDRINEKVKRISFVSKICRVPANRVGEFI